MFFKVDDWRINGYVADKWQATDKLTLNLGLRYDYSNIVPDSKDAIAPRLGVAYAASDKMVFRGGVGKFYEPARNQFMYQVLSNAVIGSAYSFDTGTDRSATRGVRPAHPCLNPVGDGAGTRGDQPRLSGHAGGPAQPERGRSACSSTSPLLRGTPRLGYLWSWSVGVERQVVPNVAVTVDYVGNVGHDQTGTIDINEGPLDADGEVTWQGIDVFDPTGTKIPAAARGVNFRRVLEYQTLDAFNTDYQALELGVVKRMANRWSGRVELHAGTRARCQCHHRECLYHLGPAGQRRLRRDERAQPAGGLRPVEPGQPARVHDRRQLGRRARAGHRGDLRVLHRQPGE